MGFPAPYVLKRAKCGVSTTQKQFTMESNDEIYYLPWEKYTPCECGGTPKWLVQWDAKGLFTSIACSNCEQENSHHGAIPICMV